MLTVTRTLALVAIVCTAGTALSACKSKVNKEKLEKSIRDEFKNKIGQEPKSVECPSEVVEKKGETFTCEVVIDDQNKGVITVTMMGEGNIEWLLTSVNGQPVGGKPATAPKPGGDQPSGGGPTGDEPTGDLPAGGAQ
jgi:hypothetical protein